MKILECIYDDGLYKEYLVELSEEDRSNTVDGKTFHALNIVDNIYRRYGVVIAILAAIPLAIWVDLK